MIAFLNISCSCTLCWRSVSLRSFISWKCLIWFSMEFIFSTSLLSFSRLIISSLVNACLIFKSFYNLNSAAFKAFSSSRVCVFSSIMCSLWTTLDLICLYLSMNMWSISFFLSLSSCRAKFALSAASLFRFSFSSINFLFSSSICNSASYISLAFLASSSDFSLSLVILSLYDCYYNSYSCSILFLLRDSLCLCICCLQIKFCFSLSSCSSVFMASMRTCLSNYCCIFSNTFIALIFYCSIMFIEFIMDRLV